MQLNDRDLAWHSQDPRFKNRTGVGETDCFHSLLEAYPTEKLMSERRVLGGKKGFIHWPKNGEQGALFTNQLLNSRQLRSYRYRIEIIKEMDLLTKERNINVFSGNECRSTRNSVSPLFIPSMDWCFQSWWLVGIQP